MFDATTKIESGVLDGNLLWLGSYDECKKVVATTSVNEAPEQMFKGKPCTVVVNNASNVHPTEAADGQKTSFGGLSLEVCVPDDCTTEDSMHLVNTGEKIPRKQFLRSLNSIV